MCWPSVSISPSLGFTKATMGALLSMVKSTGPATSEVRPDTSVAIADTVASTSSRVLVSMRNSHIPEAGL